MRLSIYVLAVQEYMYLTLDVLKLHVIVQIFVYLCTWGTGVHVLTSIWTTRVRILTSIWSTRVQYLPLDVLAACDSINI